jgi:AraC-like DNA-binding protein
MADVLVLLSAPPALDRVRRALALDAAGGTRHALLPCRDWPEVLERGTRSPLGVALVDPYHAGTLAADEIRRLRERVPRVEVLAYADFAHRPAADAFALALLGVRAVLSLNAGDDPPALWRCLSQHLNAGPLDELSNRLGERVPPGVLAWLAPALRSPTVPATADGLARAACCSPRTLRRVLRAAGLPPASELLAWRRLLHAARLMEDPHRSVDSVAHTLDYSSGSALRKSLRTLTGLRPRQVVAGGGLRLVSRLFLARCGVSG